MADLPIGSSGAGAATEAWPSAQTLGTPELDLQVGGRGDSFAGLFGDAVASHDLPGTWTAAEGQRATSSTSAFSEPGGAQAAGRPTADKVLHQVSQTLRQLPTGDSTLRLQLNPLELGQLEIEISFRNGVMMGKLRAEQGQTWKLLQDGIDGLRTRLQEQGIVVQSLEVELGRPSDFSQHHQRSPQQSFDWDQQRQSGGYFADQDPAEKRPRRIREQPEAGVEPAKTRNGGWAVNVVI
jgi:flagellar hook-length control protein FliK